jgi:hypothetical protein
MFTSHALKTNEYNMLLEVMTTGKKIIFWNASQSANKLGSIGKRKCV